MYFIAFVYVPATISLIALVTGLMELRAQRREQPYVPGETFPK